MCKAWKRWMLLKFAGKSTFLERREGGWWWCASLTLDLPAPPIGRVFVILIFQWRAFPISKVVFCISKVVFCISKVVSLSATSLNTCFFPKTDSGSILRDCIKYKCALRLHILSFPSLYPRASLGDDKQLKWNFYAPRPPHTTRPAHPKWSR